MYQFNTFILPPLPFNCSGNEEGEIWKQDTKTAEQGGGTVKSQGVCQEFCKTRVPAWGLMGLH